MRKTSAKPRSKETHIIPILGVNYEAPIEHLDHTKLRFYPKNPRVYSLIHDGSSKKWSQEDIELLLTKQEHVIQLCEQIRMHGGLMEPLYVKNSTKDVVEGNSRLAAYRMLAGQNAVQWELVKCAILPSDISDSAISSLLGQLHLKGKTKWVPYEQAGFLYRRHKEDKVSIPNLTKEIALSAKAIKHKIAVIAFMIKHGDNTRDHWSHYDELLKARKIKQACDDHPDLEETIVGLVKQDDIRAVDVRSKLKAVCSTKSRKPVEVLIGGGTLDSALKIAQSHGGDHAPLQRVKKFRLWLGNEPTKRAIARAKGQIHDEVAFELRGIKACVEALLKRLG